MLTMAGTYNFSAPYVDPSGDDPNWSIMITLGTSSASEEAAAMEASIVLQRMAIDWLMPLGKPHGPWRVNRTKLASFFAIDDRAWLIGEQLIRPAFDREEIAGRRR